ncbi:MAG: FAD-binding oxidoreductase [Haliea sp.]|jgi:glycine/D-amino acid oxidase-like deaminating enzyme|nr:FAD-binding oxidoreductase [Haliea sp.]MDP4788972.1 FAD-binding oxidoreductase [Haliea sp.]MDP5063820.1 FAD-binding oxidoreductase [Haliea sp.]
MNTHARVAVLGAGIMGCSVALYLARRGVSVTLFDEAEAPFCGASRWNEGKIHLGYIYSADPTLRSALHVLEGSLQFRPLLEDLLGTSLQAVISEQDDIYLCHRNSVVPVDAMAHYLDNVSDKVRDHPAASHYLADVSQARARRLPSEALGAVSDSEHIVAGFHVPERSVETNWIANRFVAAVHANPKITLRCEERVLGAIPATAGNPQGPWRIQTAQGTTESFSHVINALWQGRMAIDQTVGIEPSGVWSNRYRQSLFLRTSEPVQTPCAIVATGPFGDIKNYNGRDFYLSWYPDGLRLDSAAVEPPAAHTLNMPNPAALSMDILNHLEELLPWVRKIRSRIEHARIEGGWVFAAGRGELSDPVSSLHKRCDYGVQRVGNYLSIDTGKYSTAPWTAQQLVYKLFGDT